MLRIVLILFSLAVLGTLNDQATAQEEGFGFGASFESKPEGDTTTTPATPGTEKKSENTFESYESWPSKRMSATHERAAFRARQRDMRIEARKWYGYSASRPAVYGNPHYSTYMVGAYSSWGNNFWAPNWYTSNLAWYYPRNSYSNVRWIAVPAESYSSVPVR